MRSGSTDRRSFDICRSSDRARLGDTPVERRYRGTLSEAVIGPDDPHLTLPLGPRARAVRALRFRVDTVPSAAAMPPLHVDTRRIRSPSTNEPPES